MIAGLEGLLEPTRQPGLRELRACVEELFGGPETEGRLLREERLDSSGSVNRVWLEIDGEQRTFVAKRSRPAPAQRNSFVIRRWLPAVGLEWGAPRILATAAERGGRCVWHVYEDLGDRTLATDRDPMAIRSAVALLAEMHTRFVRHPMLVEAREWGGELGSGFYASNVQDAITCLDAIPLSRLDGIADGFALKDRLLARMHSLHDEEPHRTEAIAELGGPNTLLHGDLWLKNAAVVRQDGESVRVGLIDWDHAGLGPVGYDLSTSLCGFPPEQRNDVLGLYEQAIAPAGWQLPSREGLNHLFATFELARLANCVVWSAFEVSEGPHVDWALEDLRMADDWLRSLETVLEAG